MDESPGALGQGGAAGPADLGMAIDRDGEVPIGVQLAWALRARIHERGLEAGQRLPGVRDLAEETGVNVNTARAVYQRLEQEGMVESQQGSGTFVAAGSPDASQVGAIAASAAQQARQAGIDPREVAAALYVSSPPLGETEQDAATRRATLRTQIATLETALREIEGVYPTLTPPPEVADRGRGPRLLGIAELEQTRAQLVRRLARLQAAIDALGVDERAAQEASVQPSKGAARKRTRRRAVKPAPAGA